MIPICQGEQVLARIHQQQAEAAKPGVAEAVASILAKVRQEGDAALRRLAGQFGDTVPESFVLTDTEVEAAIARVPEETRQLLRRAADNIRAFGQSVLQSVQPVHLNRPGFSVGLDWRPVERVACYVPGGRYPLPSTALMTAVTARVAGVTDIVLVSPSFPDETVYAGSLAGVTRFYRLGGAQAVAAVAYGTESIVAADMLVGPGNAYVTEAKRQLQGLIGIDMLAGPSEVAIIADAGANPQWLALDLLAQAEHDPDARAFLLTDSVPLAEQTRQALEDAVGNHPGLPAHLRETGDWGRIFALSSLADCADAANRMAPEHLELQVADPQALKPLLRHYGALFMGYHAPVPVGDYMAGPNHTLPTNRSARFSGGLTPLTFLRPQSWINISQEAEPLLKDAARFAELEGLTAHALASNARLNPIGSTDPDNTDPSSR